MTSKIERQLSKTALPISGSLPFVPELHTNRKGQQVVRKAAVTHGPKKGKIGYVDTSGRIWIKDGPTTKPGPLGRSGGWRKILLSR